MTIFIPPIVTIGILIITQHLQKSLFAGIITAALFAKKFVIRDAIILTGKTLLFKSGFAFLALQSIENNLDEKIFIWGFLLAISSLIEVMTFSHILHAFSLWMKKYIRSSQKTELAILAVSTTLCIDDYLNVVGTTSIMQPLTDKIGISRMRLATLITGIATPLAALIPFSVWGATLPLMIEEAKIISLHQTGIDCYLSTIPFIFYGILTIGATLFFALFSINLLSFKYHALKENNTPQDHPAVTTGDLFSCMTGFCSFFIGIILMSIFFNTHMSLEQRLFAASTLSLVLTTGSLIFYKHKLLPLLQSIGRGMKGIIPTIGTLILAFTFGSMMNDHLSLGKIIAHNTLISSYTALIPSFFLLISVGLTFIIGSSWGAMTIMFPLAVSLMSTLASTTPVYFINMTIGAIISGALIANTLSPFADITLMATSFTKISSFEYFHEQAKNLFPALCGTFSAFLTSGFALHRLTYWQNSLFSLIIGILVTSIATFSIRYQK